MGVGLTLGGATGRLGAGRTLGADGARLGVGRTLGGGAGRLPLLGPGWAKDNVDVSRNAASVSAVILMVNEVFMFVSPIIMSKDKCFTVIPIITNFIRKKKGVCSKIFKMSGYFGIYFYRPLRKNSSLI